MNEELSEEDRYCGFAMEFSGWLEYHLPPRTADPEKNLHERVIPGAVAYSVLQKKWGLHI